MSIRFQCPSCGVVHGINERAIGRRIRCRECNELVHVTPYQPPESELGPEDLEIIEEEYAFEPDDDFEEPAPPPVLTAVASPPAVLTALPRQRRRKLAGARRPLQEAEMDMTPMVDVTFQLLIFFMLTASFTMQKSLAIPKPEISERSAATRSIQDYQDRPDYIVVRVDSYNTYHISAAVWNDELEVPSPQELLVKLRQARKGDDRGNVPRYLLVVASGEALHERVVTAIDAGNEVGMDEVQLVTVEEDQ
jgi:biopolymer transport protein ExbD